MEKNKNFDRSIIVIVLFMVLFSVVLAYILKYTVLESLAADFITEEDVLISSSDPTTQEFIIVATSSDSTTDLNNNDVLISIRNCLFFISGLLLFFWIYDRLKSIIFRLGGVRKQ